MGDNLRIHGGVFSNASASLHQSRYTLRSVLLQAWHDV